MGIEGKKLKCFWKKKDIEEDVDDDDDDDENESDFNTQTSLLIQSFSSPQTTK